MKAWIKLDRHSCKNIIAAIPAKEGMTAKFNPESRQPTVKYKNEKL